MVTRLRFERRTYSLEGCYSNPIELASQLYYFLPFINIVSNFDKQSITKITIIENMQNQDAKLYNIIEINTLKVKSLPL